MQEEEDEESCGLVYGFEKRLCTQYYVVHNMASIVLDNPSISGLVDKSM